MPSTPRCGKLGLDHLDLYLIHQPFGDVYGSWRALQKLYREGRVRAIGVSNFYPDRLIDLIDHNEVAPAVNQVETHPFFQRTAEQELMRERGVQIESWGPFAEGRNNLFTHPVLGDIAKEHGKSVPQVVLRWLVQREVVVIPKSVRADRMAENFDVFDFALTEEEMARIAAMDTGRSLFFDHRDPAMVSRIGHRPAARLTRRGSRRYRTAPSAQEGEPHGPVRVVAVGVHQDHRLPGAQRQLAADHRQCGVRRHERGQHVVAAVSGRAVPVPPAVVGGQQRTQRLEEVVVAAGARLDHRKSGRRVRGEHVEQPVPPPCGLAQELRAGVGQVVDRLGGTRRELQGACGEGVSHVTIFARGRTSALPRARTALPRAGPGRAGRFPGAEATSSFR